MNGWWYVWFAGLGAFLLAWLGPKLWRKIQRATTVPDTRLPHERYPRILNWQKGDRFQQRNGKYWPDFFAGEATLVGLTTNGRVFLKDFERIWSLSVDDVCECCWNLDASNREISEEMKASKGYTQALSEFNQSVQELHSRDEQHGVDLPDEYYPKVPVDLYM